MESGNRSYHTPWNQKKADPKIRDLPEDLIPKTSSRSRISRPIHRSPKNQLQHAGIAPVHIFKTEGARIYFRFNDKSQWNPRISHHFGSKSTNSLSNPNIIAYSEPPWCPLPLTTLSFMQDMKNEAAGIQKCVQFEHTGGRRWHLNCSSAAKS